MSLQVDAVTSILSEAQAFTNAWADVGESFSVQRTGKIAVWIDYDKGDSTGIKLRVIGRVGTSTSDFQLPIQTVTPDYVSIAAQYFKLPASDTAIAVPFDVDGLVTTLQVQIMADTAGDSPGEVSELYVSASGRR